MPQSQTGHVFISYSRRDDAVMRRIVKHLRSQGIKAWVDNEKLIPGTPVWEKEIENAIKSASAIVVVLSPDSKSSNWVRREITLADQYHIRVFPILVKGGDEDSIPLRLITHQFIDLRKDESAGLLALSTAISFFIEELAPVVSESKTDKSVFENKLEFEEKDKKAQESNRKSLLISDVFRQNKIVFTILAGIVIVAIGAMGSSYLSNLAPSTEVTATNTLTLTPRMTATNTILPSSTHTSSPTVTSCLNLYTPENGDNLAASGKFDFTWETMPEAEIYLLEITAPNNVAVTFENEEPNNIRFAESLPLAGEYQWKVTALDKNQEILCHSDRFSFTKPETIVPKATNKSGRSNPIPTNTLQPPTPP